MNCHQCGEPIPDSLNFCPKCGAAMASEQNAASSPTAQHPSGASSPGQMPLYSQNTMAENTQPVMDQREVKKHKKSKLKMILIIAASVVVLACAVLIPVLLEKARYGKYVAAIDLMGDGDLADAQNGFLELGDYKRSADMAEECQNIMDYNAATVLMEAGEYDKAKMAFNVLDGFENADELAAECQNIMDYNAATVLMEAGNNEEARDAFLALSVYMDSVDLAAECQNRLDYETAAALMAAEDYEAAQLAFEALGYYSDASAQDIECQNRIVYIAADAAFTEGKFYTAYVLFSNLDGFNDSEDRATQCIQVFPEIGEIYRNPDYDSKKCSITIKLGDEGRSSYIKFYSDSDVLVSTVFLTPGESVKIKLPTGSYRIKTSYGYQWFGEGEMFGNDGTYEVLVFDDGTEYTAFSSRYIYTLSFLQEEGGNIGSNELDPDSF